MSTLVGQSNDPNQTGVLGESATSGGGSGVYGRDRTPKGNGVIGYSENGRGVWGHSKTGFGVLGESVNGRGVVATSETDYAIRGHSKKLSGIRASSDEGNGVEGWAINSTGVVGVSTNGHGIWGQTEGAGTGVIGTSKSGVGVHGKGSRLARFFEGDVEVTGDIRLANADCAEDFNVSAVASVEPGTIMVLGEEEVLLLSHQAYDKRVAGVISGAGNYKPGIVLDKQESQQRRLPVALLGKVFCKVDAQFGAIEVGDLLTTSSTPGHAMRADDPMKAFGAVIGKALRSLKEGQGLIPILITLQ